MAMDSTCLKTAIIAQNLRKKRVLFVMANTCLSILDATGPVRFGRKSRVALRAGSRLHECDEMLTGTVEQALSLSPDRF